jgi:hypothetical protein
MIILSHRGCWGGNIEKNSQASFERSFELGFGIETDVRDYKGELVISHDIANKDCILVQDLFEIYAKYNNSFPLALNIKSDGLQVKLKRLILKYGVKNYFIFDTSIPDGLGYLRHNFNYFTRQSEYEPSPAFYDISAGVWIDEFKSHWVTANDISQHMDNNKMVSIVSPELHGRSYKKEWKHYQEIQELLGIKDMMLCTDYPEEARRFFYDK